MTDLYSTMDTSGGQLKQDFSSGTTRSLLLVVVLCLTLAIMILRWSTNGGSKEPPSLKGTIPIISNTYQYMTDMQLFLQRVA
jgi:hypothetical protein